MLPDYYRSLRRYSVASCDEIGLAEKKTCIGCHKGIAHKRPKGMKDDEGE